MPQRLLPIFPADVKYINPNIGVQTKGDNVYYFISFMMPAAITMIPAIMVSITIHHI